jgi:6-pyruvoyltetrahydropterin/6-carboxytetrahydropterin synthase
LLSEWRQRKGERVSDAARVEELQVELGRRYHFSASHRLHSEHLSAEENVRVFGKCNNPFGHGHNYMLEVNVSGKVDPTTGMIANLADLDGYVESAVLQALDHKSLNDEVAAFREKVPTTENLCIEIYERLKDFSHAKLERVRIEETRNNSFEYAGEAVADVPAASAVAKEPR